jgi:hypothetical protein
MERGLPVTLVPLSPVDAAGNDLSREALMQMAQRYGGDAVLVGRGGGGSASGQWQGTLNTNFSSESWSGPLASGINGAVDTMASVQGGSLAQTEASARVEIEGVPTLADYANVERLLESIPRFGANVAPPAAMPWCSTGGARWRRCDYHALSVPPPVRRTLQCTTHITPTGLGLGTAALGPDVRHLQLSAFKERAPLIAAALDREYLLALVLFIVAGLSMASTVTSPALIDLRARQGPRSARRQAAVGWCSWAAWLGLAPWWLTSAVVARDVLIVLGATVLACGSPLRGRQPFRADQHHAAVVRHGYAPDAAMSGGAP